MSARRVLVTGAAGFVGRHVARACLAAGQQVTAVDRRPPPADLRRDSDVRVCSFDDPTILDLVETGTFAAVLHLAAISSTVERDWEALRRTNILGPTALAQRCASSGSRFVYASSSSVYGRITERRPIAETAFGTDRCSGPLNLYARSKALFDERMLAELGTGGHDLGWVGLRFTNVFGTGEGHKKAMASILSQFLRATARRQPVTVFADTLEACRDYVPAETVARTCVLLADASVPSGVYNLGSGHAISFAELLRWCEQFAGAPLSVRLIPNPYADHYQYWTCADMTAMDRVLPHRPSPDREALRDRAHELYRRFRRAA
jgi:ADP-L-glycero-D-manno-heptose 6-epimerase